MNSKGEIVDISADYYLVDIKNEPDFSEACITGVILSQEDENKMRKRVGQVIEAGNNLSGYSRSELAQLCNIKSSQFSKIVRGEAWLNIGNLGLWGFATGITPTDVVQGTPLNASPSQCISWFINGHLHHFDHDEFELFTKLICRRLGLRHCQVNVSGDHPVPKLRDKNWQTMYIDDLITTAGKRIKQLREQLGLSQKGFSDILGVTPETIKRYESGQDRINRGVFSTFRLFATTHVCPIEITKGSIHHRLRYVQEQRFLALHEITKQLDYEKYKVLKNLTLNYSKI
ncbi:helix-turn-helix domain-containing protein [Agarilytica rhodophyticola]|uniref:helix-turn-helix domain-containing protein n=1 Tax=Agarilytica rhodophyticola TaxID=1737490 RepID=UPI000B34271A|nr:helix-turn-helix domain-containing protein [Agarilytica rhodophyticola]